MKRPSAIGGRSLPRQTGKCALCGESLGSPRDGSTRLLSDPHGWLRLSLVCRDENGCRARRKESEK